jgi:hypothetical protein
MPDMNKKKTYSLVTPKKKTGAGKIPDPGYMALFAKKIRHA